MGDLRRLDPSVSSSSPSCLDDMLSRVGVGNTFSLGTYTATTSEFHSSSVVGNSMLHGHQHQLHHQLVTGGSSDMSDLIKVQIANHPRYPNLLSAYIECQKVGAPPEMTSILEEIGRENYTTTRSCSEIGADPELDEFMGSYCEILQRYKEELSKPFDEAKTFLNNIESQLSNLCEGVLLTRTLDNHDRSDEAGGTSEEEPNYGEGEAPECQESFVAPQGDEEVKGMLMRKYSGYLSSLRKEFLKKKKKGKLPKNARMTLMAWWNNHYRWPYPTEEEKVKLSEETGLDQKQINNWFINQRKRHWKPSEDMRFALLDDVSVTGNNIEEPIYFDIGDGTRFNSTSYLK